MDFRKTQRGHKVGRSEAGDAKRREHGAQKWYEESMSSWNGCVETILPLPSLRAGE